MSDPEFQRHVTDSLARLETKMTILVGEDGTGGRMASVEDRVSSLERHRWKQAGFLSAVSAIIGAAFSALVAYWRHS